MVNVNANDIAVMGATPRWLLATLLLPEGTTESQVAEMFRQIREACADLNVSLIGGHTEITHGIDRPIALGAMLGEVDKEDAVLSSGVQPGDSLILTKGIALEGTSILAREAPDRLRDAGVSQQAIDSAARLLFDPGISVLDDARIVRASGEVHAMHDPTEGGLSGGLYELATAAGVGFEIDEPAIPILPECRLFCDALGLDPLGLIASGSLLAAVHPGSTESVVDALGSAGIGCSFIGRATDSAGNVEMQTPTGTVEFPRFARDEIARFFD